MIRLWTWLAFSCALIVAGPIRAAAPHRAEQKYPGAQEMARRIDRHLEASWKKALVVPAAAADDGEWLRRVYLDLSGRIPTVQEARSFLDDRRADRRVRLVEKLLDGPRFSSHFAAVWTNLLLPEAASNLQVRFQAPTFERRLQQWLRSGKGVDAFAMDLLSTPLGGEGGGLESFYTGGGNGLAPFYAAKDYKAEEVASAVSRVFLGVNIGCAQCHNHPFAKWNRDEFWSFAAFFSGLRSTRMGDFFLPEPEQPDVHELTIPNTQKKVSATFLGGKKAAIEKGSRSRKVLAEWVVAKENPYFARAITNRSWAYFFGHGLQEPIDEMAGADAEPYHPEILDELARGFAEHDFDLRWLMRTITATRSYQLSSRRSHASQDDATKFARASLRGLSGAQLFDSLAQATGHRESSDPTMGFNPFNASGRGQFISQFGGTSEKPTDVQTSILQALTLMNGQLVAVATNVQNSETLAAIADAPFMTVSGKIETLYLAALSRRPTSKELSRLVSYVEKTGAEGSEADREKTQSEALADIFWSLLNSSEFYLNH